MGVEALNIARNFLQSVRFTPLANKEIVRASAVGAIGHSNQNEPVIRQTCVAITPLWIMRATKITNDSCCDPAPETIEDPRASPSDSACKTNPKVKVKPFPETRILCPSPVIVLGVPGRCAPVEIDLGVVGRGDRTDSPSNSPSSRSASNSTVEAFGESELESGMCGPE